MASGERWGEEHDVGRRLATVRFRRFTRHGTPRQSAIASRSEAMARGWEGERESFAFKIVSSAPAIASTLPLVAPGAIAIQIDSIDRLHAG